MAARPDSRSIAQTRCRLEPFQPEWAPLVVSWARDEREAYWLAPKSPPPLTAEQVIAWRTLGHNPFVLRSSAEQSVIGYGELNEMEGARRTYWLGHLIVDPAQRGRGYGVELTRLLLGEAFERRGARRVTLVVFPENRVAIACYRAAGMQDDGFELHDFAAYGRREVLLRMAVQQRS